MPDHVVSDDVLALMRGLIRDVPDFPKPGIVFKDITPLLGNARGFSSMVDAITLTVGRGTVDKVVGMEARGFIIAAPVAYHLAAGFVPVRKAGKLPHETSDVSYALEYGEATLEIHRDAIEPGDRVAIVDDVLATGGTAAATAALVEDLGGVVASMVFLIELGFLDGRARLANYDPRAVIVL